MIGTVDIAALHDLFGEWLVHGCCDSFSDGDEVREGMDPRDPADGNYLTGRSPEWYLDAYPGVLAAVTNADGSVSLGLADPAASNLYYTVGVCLDVDGFNEQISVSNGNGFAPV